MDFKHACTELRLYAENTGELYPEVRRLVGRLAWNLKAYPNLPEENLLYLVGPDWYDLCQRAAGMYKKEIKVSINFTRPVIKMVAHQWATDYLKRLRSGEEGLCDV